MSISEVGTPVASGKAVLKAQLHALQGAQPQAWERAEADASDVSLELAAAQLRLRKVMVDNNTRLAALRRAVADSPYPEPGSGVPASSSELQTRRDAQEALVDEEWGNELVTQYQRCCLWRTLVTSMERGVRDQEPDFNKRKNAVRQAALSWVAVVAAPVPCEVAC